MAVAYVAILGVLMGVGAGIASIKVANRLTRTARETGIGKIIDAYKVEQVPADAKSSWLATVFLEYGFFPVPEREVEPLFSAEGLTLKVEPDRWLGGWLMEQLCRETTISVVPWQALTIRRSHGLLSTPSTFRCCVETDGEPACISIFFPLNIPSELQNRPTDAE